jgi:MoxR-like ATPase
MAEKKDFKTLFEEHEVKDENEKMDLVLEGQYKEAYDILDDAYHAKLNVGIVGPVGCGKTILCRKFAGDKNTGFSWITFNDLIRSASLIGSFDPSSVFQKGYTIENFNPGPFTRAALEGNIFFANEINRGQEFVLNTLLDALEEKRVYIPQLKKWINVDENFFFVAAMNPSDMRGTRILPKAIKDRIGVWITLTYPDKVLELKILRVNCREMTLGDDVLQKIVKIVQATRMSPDVVVPASIRCSINFARLLARRATREGKLPNADMISKIGRLVLREAIEMTPSMSTDTYINKLLAQIVGVT